MVIVVGIILRCCIVFTVPQYYAPDEQAHYKYITYIGQHHALPVAYSKTDSPTNDWEYYQPPLYYSMMSVMFPFFTDETLFYGVRLCSVALYGITAFFLYGLMKKKGYGETSLALAQVFLAFLPTYVFISSAINNDNLLNTLAAVTLFYTIFPLKKYGNVWVGVLLGLSTLTKMSSIIIYTFVIMYYIIEIVKKRKTAKELVIVMISSIAMVLPLLYRNMTLYGSLMGDSFVHVPYTWPNIINATKEILRVFNHSFIGVAGIHNNIMSRYTYLLDIVILVSLLAMVWKIRVNMKSTSVGYGDLFEKVAPFAAMVIVNLAMIYMAGYLYFQPQGRFLYASFVPLCMLFSYGYTVIAEKLKIKGIWLITVLSCLMISHVAILCYKMLNAST